MRLLAIVIALLLLAPEAHAQTKKQRLKGWELTSEKDRFSGKLDTVIGSSLQQSTALFIRCLHGEQSIAVAHVSFGPGRYAEEDMLEVLFRADQKDVIKTFGIALSDKMVQVAKSEEIIASMRGAKEYAFRITFKSTTNDLVFKAFDADRVVDAVVKACPPAPQPKPAVSTQPAQAVPAAPTAVEERTVTIPANSLPK